MRVLLIGIADLAEPALKLNLEAASFVNGAELPRTVTIANDGKVVDDDLQSAIRVDLDSVIAFPGLVNSHEHLEFNLYPQLGDPPYADVDEWAESVHRQHAPLISRIEAVPVELRRYWGLLKNLTSGVTTVMDHGENNADENCALPMRTVRPFRFVHRADKPWAWLQARFMRGSGPMVFHVGEGSSAAVKQRSERFLRRLKTRGPLVGVHGISLNQESARHLDALVWCPVSNLFLYGRTADVRSLKAVTTILFGTDSGISAEGSIWDQLRVARECGVLSDTELLDSVTSNATRAWGLTSNVDLVVAKRRHPNPLQSFFDTGPADISAVISGGQLALMSDALFCELPPGEWQQSYREIEIGKIRQHIHKASSGLLTRLASISDAPLSLR